MKIKGKVKKYTGETMADFKELLEDNLLAVQANRYFNMSISDLQKEADVLGFDISTLFK